MLKKFIAAVLLMTATVISSVSVMADAGMSDLYYTVDGLDINISNCSVYKDNERAADLFVAVYDGDYLMKINMINVAEDSTNVILDDFTITLDSEPTDLKVKAFLWSTDGNCEPLSDALELRDLSEKTKEVSPDSSWAIVSDIRDMTKFDGIDCTEIFVARDGMEDVSVLIKGEVSYLSEGAVISYVVGESGYVEADDIYVLYTPASTYSDMYNDAINGPSDIFNENAAFGPYFSSGESWSPRWKALVPIYGKNTLKEVYVYYGPVYQKQPINLDIFLTKSDGVSSVNGAVEFDIRGVNSYIYDYKQRPGHRVETGSYNHSSSLYYHYFNEGDSVNINWSKIEETKEFAPYFAIVKTVDDEVTDVIYYIGEW